jgi:hypothetical protein
VLGGTLNALIAPVVFDRVVEYPLMMAAVFLLRPHWDLHRIADFVSARGKERAAKRKLQGSKRRADKGRQATPAIDPRKQQTRDSRGWPGQLGHEGPAFATATWCLLGLMMAALFWMTSRGIDGLYWLASRMSNRDAILLRGRNFFGVVQVVEPQVVQPQDTPFIGLLHGTTTHGLQSRRPNERRIPRSYFHPAGPIGQIFHEFSGDKAKKKIGVLGLGIGSLAAYTDRGQEITFYEIDPAVARIASDPQYFTFLSDCQERGARLNVVLGDGRLKLAQSQDQYGLLFLDAFSSDSVPLHLLTRQALQLYLKHLEDHGILIFNVTNGYLHLSPVLAKLADDAGLVCFEQTDMASTAFTEAIKEAKKTGRFNFERLTHAKNEFPLTGRLPSHWVIAARQKEDFGKLLEDSPWRLIRRRPDVALWSDDYSNLLSALIWDTRQDRLTAIIEDELSSR